jgi:ribosomal-protein-alanine N-acetyltransferase
LLEGNRVNLRVLEKEDLSLVTEWANDPEFSGEYEPLEQISYDEVEKWYVNLSSEEKWFIIEKKDGNKIGQIFHSPRGPHFIIGYKLLPSERNKGYGTEAVQVIVDYLFLSKNSVRIQAETNPRNMASQRVLEKAGFKREGLIRRSVFIRGKWEDGLLYSIIREEWKEPRILTKKAP